MVLNEPTQRIARGYALVLSVLAALFVFRVAAQLIQFWHPMEVLPPFEAWHSGALPYGMLLAAQGAIGSLCGRIIWRLYQGGIPQSTKKGKWLLYLGSLYLVVMSIRLVLGLTIASQHAWFGATLPAFFHLVLAMFVILYGRYHLTATSRMKMSWPGGVL